ncbi:MAG: Hpt domain-containing protein, partial [Nitrospirae bacterium]|nr:Hpt domain-containing protein [Nitrospirota bacterium]
MDLSAIKQTFLAEVEEVLQNMEDFILNLESHPDDKDNINALFRAAHTIKGSAGIIGLEDVERFTHKVENVLDRLRSEKIDVSCDLIGLMLKSKDHIKKLVECSFSDKLGNEVKDKVRDTGDDISSCLTVYMFQAPGATDSSPTGSSASDSSDPGSIASASLGEDAGVSSHGSGTWHVSLRFGKSVIRDGMDPISMINYLSKLGRIINLATIVEALPRAEEMDPEDCYLGFEIDLNSSCNKQTIEDVFEFVMDDSEIKVIPPHSSIDTYVRMIRSLPEDSWMLGDILVKGGVVTRRDIDIALKKQVSEAEGSGEKPYIGDILVKEGIVRREIVDAALDKQQQVREGLGSSGTAGQPISSTTSTIRVDSEKLDLLLNFVGELVVATGGIKQRALDIKDLELLKSSTFLTKLVDDVRDMSMKMRMIPIGTIFNRFQ